MSLRCMLSMSCVWHLHGFWCVTGRESFTYAASQSLMNCLWKRLLLLALLPHMYTIAALVAGSVTHLILNSFATCNHCVYMAAT
jgi:hypothetical protein